jgi:hypothetical protein
LLRALGFFDALALAFLVARLIEGSDSARVLPKMTMMIVRMKIRKRVRRLMKRKKRKRSR